MQITKVVRYFVLALAIPTAVVAFRCGWGPTISLYGLLLDIAGSVILVSALFSRAASEIAGLKWAYEHVHGKGLGAWLQHFPLKLAAMVGRPGVTLHTADVEQDAEDAVWGVLLLIGGFLLQAIGQGLSLYGGFRTG